MVRAPLWLTRKGYFKGKERYFSCLDFIAQLTLLIPGRQSREA
jgi:hypothetical protein